MPANGISYLDPKSALEYLKTYDRPDGLSVSDLMDSRVNGGVNLQRLHPPTWKDRLPCLRGHHRESYHSKCGP